jgi:serine protease Do
MTSKQIVCVGLLGAFLGVSTAAGQTPARASGTDLSSTVEATAQLANPAVVEIITTSYAAGDGAVARAADLVARRRGSGSGVMVDPEGSVITNAHVVASAQRLRVEVPVPVAGASILARRSRSMPPRSSA